MLIFVANLGSTSFKYSLFETGQDAMKLLARDGYERVEDHGVVIADALDKLEKEGVLSSRKDIQGVGFKAVLGHNLSGCVEGDDSCLEALDQAAELAPAHNPAYAAGIRQFRKLLPEATRVALFETAFYQWVPEAKRRYAVPRKWYEAGIVRNGFHGASHKFIAERSASLMGRADVEERVRNLYRADGPPDCREEPFRVISCHLGGSSSVTGMRNGIAVGCSLGLSPQSGLPHNNRVGDLDSMAIPLAMKRLGLSLDQVESQLTKESGLKGLSGVGNDLRDILEARASGNPDAALAFDVLVHSIRQWIGSFHFDMGGAEAIVFTAGIGENNPLLREKVLDGLQNLGIQLDNERNQAGGKGEYVISTDASKTKIWVIPTNEEEVVARETEKFIIQKQ